MVYNQEEYDDWLGDNISELRKDFTEEHYQTEFDDYCRKEFYFRRDGK